MASEWSSLQRQDQVRRKPGRPLTVYCPHCNAKLKHDGSREGQTVPCPRCHNPFQFPVLTQSPPAETPANSSNLTFSDDPEPSYGSKAREPWFYGFLET